MVEAIVIRARDRATCPNAKVTAMAAFRSLLLLSLALLSLSTMAEGRFFPWATIPVRVEDASKPRARGLLNQICPYCPPLLYDYVEFEGTQDQLIAAARVLLDDPALPALLGVGGASSAGSQPRLEAIAALLRNPGIKDLLRGVDVGALVLGDGFKGGYSTLINSNLAPPALQPLLIDTGPYIPYIISNYYSCGGETTEFFAAINSVLDNPLVKPFLANPELLQSTAGNTQLLASTFPALYSSVVTNNPILYNWLVTLPNQCIVDQGYIQPVAVIVTQGTMFATVGENLPKLVDDYYNTGCTTEQMLAYAPVLLEAMTLPTEEQTNALFTKTGVTPTGETVAFTQPFNGGPSILQCLTPNLVTLTSVLNVGK